MRETRGINQRKVANAVHVDCSTISRYETGEDEPPYETLLRLARFFDVDPNYLLGWETEQHQEVTEDEFLRILETHGRMIFQEMKR